MFSSSSLAKSTTLTRFFQRKFASIVAPSLHLPRPDEEDASPIISNWWTGTSPLPEDKYKIECGLLNFGRMLMRGENGEMTADGNSAETARLKEMMEETFNASGACYLTNTGLTNIDDMKAVVSILKPETIIYEGGANKRGQISKNVYDVGAPLVADLQYHHEMAYMKESTEFVSFMCMQGTADPMRGATYIAENIGATRDLMNHPSGLGQKLAEKGLCYVRKLPDLKFFQDDPSRDQSLVYNFWQTSMLTEDPDEAVEVARRKGLECEWQDSPMFGRYLVTKFPASCFEYDPYNDTNVLFASIADDYHWFDSWPGVMSLPHEERPLKLNFGDDEVFTREEKQIFTDVYGNNGIPLPWEQGDIGIICNYRQAHGRPAINLLPGEKREMGVVLGKMFPR